MNSFKINKKNKLNRLRLLQTQLNAKYEELKRLEQDEQVGDFSKNIFLDFIKMYFIKIFFPVATSI